MRGGYGGRRAGAGRADGWKDFGDNTYCHENAGSLLRGEEVVP